jgi:hypothetical protein
MVSSIPVAHAGHTQNLNYIKTQFSQAVGKHKTLSINITSILKNRNTSFVASLLILLLSSSLSAQNKLPVENTIYYQVTYTCRAPINQNIESIKCEICRDIEFSIQKDSIVFNYIDRRCVSSGETRKVYNPIKSTILNSNTILYLLEDAEKNLFKTVIKTSDKKVMVSGPTSTELELYNHLIFQLDSINNADKEAFVVKKRNIYYRSFFSELVFDNYSKLPKFTLEMYEDIKDDLSNTLPENLDHSKHSKNEKTQFNKTLENYFIDNGLNPFHGNSYYRSLQTQEKLDKGFSPERFFNKLNNVFIFMMLISVLWSLYRFYKYSKYKKSEPKVETPTVWCIKTFTALAMVGFAFTGILAGFKAGVPIGHSLGFTGGNSIGILFVMVFSIPIGGILGIILGVFISKKTRLA